MTKQPDAGASYRDLRLLSSTRGFRLFSARDARDARVVLVRPDRRADPERAAHCLRRLASSHTRVVHPLVPGVVRSHFAGENAHVALGAPAIANGFDVATRLVASETRIPYASADGFVLSLREALDAAHAAPDGPHCLGRVSLANVLFDAGGRHYLVGLGHNVAVDDEHGQPDPLVRAFQAPDLLVGREPTAMTDYVALLLLARSITTHVELPAAVKRVIEGAAGTVADRRVLRLLRFVEQRVLAEVPARRAPRSEAIRVGERIRSVLGVRPDRSGMTGIARGLLGADLAPAVGPDCWVLAADAEWIERGTDRIALTKPGRDIFVALFDRMLWGGAPDLGVWELFEKAWPGEETSYERGMNRVHAAVSRLRRAGLGDVIEHSRDGYRIAQGARIVRRSERPLV